MIKSVTAVNYLGDELKMELANPNSSGLIVRNIQGIGPGKTDLRITEVSTTDGGRFNSARTGTRNIVLQLEFLWTPTIEDTRLLTYKFFQLKKPVQLIFETDTRSYSIDGYTESNEPDIFSENESTSVSIICPYPYFFLYDTTGGINRTDFALTESLFEFPFENNSNSENLIEMSSIERFTARNIPYYGDADIGFTMHIYATGDATDIIVYNPRTNENLRIDTNKLERYTGKAFGKGDEITICTVHGQKSITLLRSGVETNILNCLNRNADWIQLHMGDNIISYSAATGMDHLRFTVENKVIYEGI